ncbi:MAG: 4-oxalomesaconate tautomerase [Pseudomonadota bacterium]
MTQTAIPYVFMRGGSSRGPYFRRDDLPEDLDALAEVLMAAVGAGHPINIDGIGGGVAVTTKVAMLSRSNEPDVDIDYFFAQVAVEERLVDYKPTCGNILSGVGPAAIELGLIEATGDTTDIRIRAVNTGARVTANVRTDAGQPVYDGDCSIAGVPGTASPIALRFHGVVGSATGAMLPTGNVRDSVEGVEVTCLDVAMPVVIARAEDMGVTGYESAAELDANTDFFARVESIRLQAGERMGMGDVSQSVTPKFAVIAPAGDGGTLATRYFMPWKTHPSMAVTGGQCLAACALLPGSVSDGLLQRPLGSPSDIQIEHPSGSLDVLMDFSVEGGFQIESAGLVRTARKLADGHVYIPSTVLAETS